MSYSTLNRTKFGDCSNHECGRKNTEVVKVGKELFCLYCRNNQKAKVQLAKSIERNKVRSLIKIDSNLELKEETDKQKWFKLIRTKLTGTCQCGCAQPSSKNDEKNYRSSCCHVFPQRIFKSVQFHPHNFVERAFWGGCHTNFDEQSMDKWVNMADWDNIKEIFYELAPLLTEMERTTKFYRHLENIVYLQPTLN